MHDWTLVKITFDWRQARVAVDLEDAAFTAKTLVAEGVRELRVPKAHEWGASVSVNEVSEFSANPDQGRWLRIEMQSGDVIQILADRFAFPVP